MRFPLRSKALPRSRPRLLPSSLRSRILRKEFEPDELERLVHETLEWRRQTQPYPALDDTYDHLVRAIDSRYPGLIQWPSKWLWNRSAGFLQAVAILYVSLTEYMLITGTPLPTNGGSGPFSGEIYDWVIEGEIVSFRPGQFEREPTRPGECDYLPQGMMKGAAITDHYWALEYGRGSVISMWPSTLFGSLLVDCNVKNLGELMSTAAAQQVRNLLRPHAVPGWSNWMGNQQCNPLSTVEAWDLSDLRSTVQRAKRGRHQVRAYGARHSWSRLVPTDGSLVDMTRLRRSLKVDPDAGTVQVQAGMDLEGLTATAYHAGLAVPSPTVATSFTVGGMVATGSHGTGMHTQTFSDAVVGMTIVNADGEVVELAEDDPDLPAARVALGSLGLIHDVTFKCPPAMNVRAIDRKCPIEETIDDLPNLVRAHHAVMLMWYPYTDVAWLKLWDPTDDPEHYGWLERRKTQWSQLLFEGVLGFMGEKLVMRFAPFLTPALMNEVIALTPQRERVVSAADAYHFQYVYPKCWDSSWSVPLEDAPEAWRAFRETIEEFRERDSFPVNLVVASRFVAKSTSLLSPDFGRDSCYIEATTLEGTKDAAVFYRAIEEVMLSRFDARPHWGKVFYDTPRIRERCLTQIEQFEAVRKRWDPEGRFLNEFLAELFGVDPLSPTGP